ncbi:dienelactone hydrolase family protein [Iodidimonas sp. SYSU 1G8]|uniref:dienelactone hydrolase family protein n=1 Tax=Iodidimonas sp. SYSU 1G8 TaxID=3133967 RepID=UPI0031FEC0AE
MAELETDIPTPDGRMNSFAAWPDTGGPFPAVILYMDAPGIREELRDFARRIASQGYFCLLPDMYYRNGVLRFDFSMDRDNAFKLVMATMATLNVDRVMRDTKGMIDWLEARPEVRGPYGCVGYCMSGQYVVAAAGTFPDKIVATASLYGVGIVTDQPDSPHLLVPNIKGELYLGFAAHDPWVADDVIPTLTKTLDQHGVAHECEIHPETEHGFCFPQRPAYVKDRAEIAWRKMSDMFDRRLKR